MAPPATAPRPVPSDAVVVPVAAAPRGGAGAAPVGRLHREICGVKTGNCLAHTGFIAGHGVSITGLVYAFSTGNTSLAALSCAAEVVNSLLQCYWARYGGLREVAQEVALTAEVVAGAVEGEVAAARHLAVAAVGIQNATDRHAAEAARLREENARLHAAHTAVVASVADVHATAVRHRDENEHLRAQLATASHIIDELHGLITSFERENRTFSAALPTVATAGAALTRDVAGLTATTSAFQHQVAAFAESITSLRTQTQAILAEMNARIAALTEQISKLREENATLHTTSEALTAQVAALRELQAERSAFMDRVGATTTTLSNIFAPARAAAEDVTMEMPSAAAAAAAASAHVAVADELTDALDRILGRLAEIEQSNRLLIAKSTAQSNSTTMR